MKNTLATIILLILGLGLTGQNLDIQGKAKIESPDTVAVLDLQGGGIVLPKLTSEERNAISNPQFGLLILNTTTNCLEIYLQKWTPLCSVDYQTNPVNRMLGGSGSEEAYSIAHTSDGAYVVTGWSASSARGDVMEMYGGTWDF